MGVKGAATRPVKLNSIPLQMIFGCLFEEEKFKKLISFLSYLFYLFEVVYTCVFSCWKLLLLRIILLVGFNTLRNSGLDAFYLFWRSFTLHSTVTKQKWLEGGRYSPCFEV